MSDMLTILQGDNRELLKTIPDQSVQCCVTSPPYWGLRDYGVNGQIGLEQTPQEYVEQMVLVFREVNRVLRDDGILFLNLGDSYAGGGRGNGGGGPKSKKQITNLGAYFKGNTSFDHGVKPKDLVGIPWMVAFALRADGWYLRQDIIWHKPNPMPESVTDRCTKAHEYLFLLSKSERYYYDADAIATPASSSYSSDSRWETGPTEENEKDGYSDALAQNPKQVHRVFNGEKQQTVNKRSVWTVPTACFKEAHFATFPPDLIRPCIMAGSHLQDTVLDPFAGSGTTGMVALKLFRKALMIELNPDYIAMIRKRCDFTPEHQTELELNV